MRERGWAEGRQQDEWKRVTLAGEENAERIADSMLKETGQNDQIEGGKRNNCGGGQTITRMRNVAYGAMHRGSHGAEIELAVGGLETLQSKCVPHNSLAPQSHDLIN